MDLGEDDFEPQLGRPPKDVRPRLAAVRAAVRAASLVGSRSPRVKATGGVRAHFAKGSSQRARPVHQAMRRVVVKVRYAANAGGRGAPLRAHVAYLAREAKAQQREPAERAEAKEMSRAVDYLSRETRPNAAALEFYDGASANIDARVVTASWSEDARHFRMIISAEDGAALGDLRPFIREVMAGLEQKLGTRLAWIAVDHHDTDNPHSHVLIRGRRPDGSDLFIPSRLISSGIREQAQEIATRILGPRLGVDLARERHAEIETPRLISLDRELKASSFGGQVHADRPDLIARLGRLEGWGLARREAGGWRLAEDLGERLKAIGERQEVEKAAATIRLGCESAVLLEADRNAVATGQLLHLAPADEFGDRFLAIIETGAGELRYAHFERANDLAVLDGVRPGAIITFEPNRAAVRPSDQAVARIAAQSRGRYSVELHSQLAPGAEPGLLRANIRRLEAMRRMGLIERTPAGDFLVGEEHLERALAFERRLGARAPVSARIASYWSLAEQVDAAGPTHLDRVLAGEVHPPGGGGRLARQFGAALDQRRQFLQRQGILAPADTQLLPSAIARMAVLERRALAADLTKELGVHVLTEAGSTVRGVYVRRIDLAQGRMALIVGERSAYLAPWRPVLERFAGREVEGLVRGQSLSWGLARPGPSLPPM